MSAKLIPSGILFYLLSIRGVDNPRGYRAGIGCGLLLDTKAQRIGLHGLGHDLHCLGGGLLALQNLLQQSFKAIILAARRCGLRGGLRCDLLGGRGRQGRDLLRDSRIMHSCRSRLRGFVHCFNLGFRVARHSKGRFFTGFQL
nr:MAG TPA: hypothetical protein [Caudoviricetes sp.]